MRFENIEFFWLIPIILICILFISAIIAPRQNLWVSNVELIRENFKLNWKVRLRWVPSFLRGLVILFLIFALARPQFGLKRVEIPSEGIDIVIALDTSSSMDLVIDNIKGKSRLEQSKSVVVDFVESFKGNRIGLVIFQSRSLILSPLTYDHNALRRQIESIETGLIDDGTAIGLGVMEGLTLLKSSPAKSRAIILLTDGQNNVDVILPVQASRVAETLGIKVYTIGFVGQDSAAGQSIDTQMLRLVAEKTGGFFYNAKTVNELKNAYEDISKLEKSNLEDITYSVAMDISQYLIWCAFTLLIFEFIFRKFLLRSYS
ncbi:MAG: aerotolerance regulator BatA [Chloroflexi bacterium]|nr:aerotolerance regulator BatA [Chloroflexota bacterium]|tara:strand:+ start:9940 stop:10890 length:951 start_codon:yes stop_codon:yes gene_type:complete